jgi:hypothetical protein
MRNDPRPNRLTARLALADRNASLAQQMADLLRTQGFQVEQVSPRGVSFTGSEDLFESVFHSRAHESATGFRFETAPQLPEAMAHAGVTVYLPTRPELFP